MAPGLEGIFAHDARFIIGRVQAGCIPVILMEKYGEECRKESEVMWMRMT
jgi:hypothetical protein